MKNSIKVGFLSQGDPNDKRSWSGIYYRMFKSLEAQGFSVIWLGPLKLDKYSKFVIRKYTLILQIIHNLFFRGKSYNSMHSHLVSYLESKYFAKRIRQFNVDVIFAPSASNQIAHLHTEIPICYYSDCTFSVMVDYYFSNLSSISIFEGKSIEQCAMKISKAQIFSSKWAFDSAKNQYKAKNPKIVKMGANFDNMPAIKSINSKYFGETLNILFVGVDWERKGGDIVLDTFYKLDESGFSVKLTIVGCAPQTKHSGIRIIPNLNKNITEQMAIFHEVFNDSHLFFLPTRAECYGIVFCEANAYGIPVISTDTGGVSSVIEDGVNGFLLPETATSQDYFNIIVELIKDKAKLKCLSTSSREKYDNELNWDQWGKEMGDILKGVSTNLLSDA